MRLIIGINFNNAVVTRNECYNYLNADYVAIAVALDLDYYIS